MMRYCAGTCPCTWVTAVALPNIAYLRQSLRIQGKDAEAKNVKFSVLTGEDREEEIKYLEYLIPAQSMMGLSSYFAWYYGYGFYGPAKYPLLLYGLTLACHSAAHEKDIVANPNAVLAHRAACAISTFLCSCCFLRLSKIASLLILPAFGVYACLTNVTMKGINGSNGSNRNRNAVDNENNNQQSDHQPLTQHYKEHQSSQLPTTQINPQFSQLKRRRKKRGKSILKLDVASAVMNGQNHQRNARELVKTNVSFDDNVGVKYRNPSLSTSSSSASLTSSLDNRDIVK